MKITFKKSITKIHLWLGLSTGLIVLLVSLSGSLYAFKDEIFDIIYDDYITVESNGQTALPLDQLWSSTQDHFGDEIELKHCKTHKDSNKAFTFLAYKKDTTAWNYFDAIVYYRLIYVNQYTGSIQGDINMKYEFFNLVKMFHWSFLLATDIGQPIIGWSIFAFLFSLITGVYMWVKSKNSLKKKSTVKWNAKWRRVNYDLHNVAGIYGALLGIIFALTGMVMSFKWFMSIVYVVTNLSITPPEKVVAHSDELDFDRQLQIVNQVKTTVDDKYPDSYSVNYSLPHHVEEKEEPLEVYVKHQSHIHYDAALEKYDWVTGELLHSLSFDNLSRGEKILYMNYDIHCGAVLGLFGKILAFLGGIVCGALPVTGFCIWWGRRNKKKGNQKLNSQIV